MGMCGLRSERFESVQCGGGSGGIAVRGYRICNGGMPEGVPRGRRMKVLINLQWCKSCGVCVAFCTLCLLALKPLCSRLRKPPTATNGDRALGREAVVLTPVSAETTGRVRLDGVDWNARCATPGDTLDPGALCRVTEIHSTLLIVEPVLTESRNPHTTT